MANLIEEILAGKSVRSAIRAESMRRRKYGSRRKSRYESEEEEPEANFEELDLENTIEPDEFGFDDPEEVEDALEKAEETAVVVCTNCGSLDVVPLFDQETGTQFFSCNACGTDFLMVALDLVTDDEEEDVVDDDILDDLPDDASFEDVYPEDEDEED